MEIEDVLAVVLGYGQDIGDDDRIGKKNAEVPPSLAGGLVRSSVPSAPSWSASVWLAPV